MSQNHRTDYRPDIDGLRALAVVAVVVFHAFPVLLPTGFVGVDVFFVISGYLITRIIVGEINSDNFSYLGFYARRARRIVPALVVVLLATWIAGRSFLLADEFKSLGKYLVAAATFTSNIALWRDAGYFDTAAASKPLLHLWSLGIEEQFYLLWPVIIVFAAKRRANMLAMTVALLAISLGANIFLTGHHTDASFYLLPTRFWELLAGAGLGQIEIVRKSPAASRDHLPAMTFIAIAGVALLIVACSGVLGNHPYPGWRAIFPVAGTAMLIGAGQRALPNQTMLSWRPVVAIGKISYPLYLWHWPILVLAKAEYGPELTHGIQAALVVASFVLAWLTWRLIEVPFQTFAFQGLSGRSKPIAHVALALSCLIFVGTVGAMTNRDMLLSSSQQEMLQVAAYRTLGTDQHGNEKCLLYPEQSFDKFPTECYTPKARPIILLWGDSFANHLYPGLKSAFGEKVDVLTLTASSCPPVLGFSSGERPHCRAINDWDFQTISKVKPDIVILQSIWSGNLKYTKGFLDEIDSTIVRLNEAGIKHIVFAGQLPVWQPSLPEIVEREYIAKKLPIPARSRIGIDPDFFSVDAVLSQHLANSSVTYVPMMGSLCNEQGCPIAIGPNLATDLTTFDAGHLTNAASNYIVRTLLLPVLKPMTEYSSPRSLAGNS